MSEVNIIYDKIGIKSDKKLTFFKFFISAKTIRKWSDNFFVLHGVPESISDFMQGRASVTVGSKNYLNKVKQAVEWYRRVMDRFPIPP
ncbi:hypothetical protein DRO97_10205 [Archaeoglobales archaeon]|nr:MAG: hypothetical protein DRO97_10205 [Archaeoglobales archaeon]